MARPKLVKAGVTLRDQLNQAYPNRDKRSDGWIGDAAHQARRAITIQTRMVGFTPLILMRILVQGGRMDQQQRVCQTNLLICREGKDKGRLKYVVYENQIASGTHSS
jgi:hypothetical protein